MNTIIDRVNEWKNSLIADPPYYNIMRSGWDGTHYDWDRWNSFEEYRNFIRLVATELKRVLKDNGSIYFFCDDKISAYIQIELDKFDWILLNHIIWWKRNNMPIKGWASLRSYATVTERILFYGAMENGYQKVCDDIKTNYVDGVNGIRGNIFSPLREYLLEEKNKVGITLEEVNLLCGVVSVAGRHYFANSQWCFPTEEHYVRMQLTFNVVYKKLLTVEDASKKSNQELIDMLRKDYDVLKKDYDMLRRPFHQGKNFTDVWDFPIMNQKESVGHPTQKPIALIRRIIETSSKEDDIVLDPFMGSGTTAVDCKQLNRHFIGFETNKEYCEMARERLEQATLKEYSLFVKV